MAELNFDDYNLVRMWQEMSERQRVESMRGAFRREAAKVRRVVMDKVRTSGIHNAAQLAKCVRGVTYKRTAGFRVTLGESRGKGYYRNRRGQERPLLRWFDTGTRDRSTRQRLGRRPHPTGEIKAYHFIEDALNEVRDKVPEELKQEFILNTLKTARKYGCR